MASAESFLVGVALKTSGLWAAAWLVGCLLRKRPAAVRHLVWTAAAAAVLALPLLSLGLPSVRLPGGGALAALVPNITFQAGAAAGASRETQPNTVRRQAQPLPLRSRINWRLGLALLWMAGSVAGIGQIVVAAAILAAARRRARVHPAQQEGAALAKAGGIRHTVDILEGRAGSMPMTCGWLRPAIFLPADAAAWSAGRRRMVLLHELAHIGRGDTGSHGIARLALALHWWNPLAWLAWREFLQERERAADDLVLLAGERASDYADLLLEVATSMHAQAPQAWAAIAMARRSQLEGRLVAILDPRIPRRSLARDSALAAALLAVVMVAPVAALRAQDRDVPAPPPVHDLDATIRTATSYAVLDQLAKEFARQQQFDQAQKLLEAALALRQKNAGPESAEYFEGLMKLGDLAHSQKLNTQAAEFYQRAFAAARGGPAAARALAALGVTFTAQGAYPAARDHFQQAFAAFPAGAGMPLTWLALTYVFEGGEAALAESAFQQALAAEDPASAETATTLELYAAFLGKQRREDESGAARAKAAAIRTALGAPVLAETKLQSRGPGVFRIGNGVTAPAVLSKQEPSYTEDARLAKYQGTAILYLEIAPDGLPRNIRIVRGLGFGLDEQAVDAVSRWKFKPGTKDGAAVTVAAQIEVNFRLL